MPPKLRQALGSAVLAGLLLLPFAAGLFRGTPDPPPAPVLALAPPPSEVVVLIRRHRYAEAYASLRESGAPADSARNAVHEFRLAVCERALGMADSAHARLLRLESRLPEIEPYRRLWLARTLELLKGAEAATPAYEELLAEVRLEAVADSARLYLAQLYLDAGAHPRALALYRGQRAVTGPSAWLLYRISEAQRLAGDEAGRRETLHELMERYPASRLALRVAARFRPRTIDERYSRAQVYVRHGDDRAISDLQQVIRNAPGGDLAPHAAYALGRALGRSGQFERARATYESLYADHGWAPALYRIAGLDVRAGRDHEAIEAYVELARRHPRHSLADDALWQAAKAAERKGLFERAGSIHADLAERYPSSEFAEDASWGAAFSLYCRQRFEEAEAGFAGLSRRARQPHLVDQSLYWAGKSARRLERGEEAGGHFTEAARGFPRSYYSTRAVSRGYGDARLPAPVLVSEAPKPGQLLEPVHLRRALVLGDLGLASVAERELRLAERANEGNRAGLRVLREAYESLGLHTRAMVLTTRLGDGGGDTGRLYPNHYWEEIAAAAVKAQVDPHLVLSVIRQESFFNEAAVSRAGAVGLMQIMPKTGRKLARRFGIDSFHRRQLFDPGLSIQLGTRYLAEQVRAFEGAGGGELSFQLGLAAYNAGPHVARRWVQRFPLEDEDVFVERIPYRETRLYVKKVLKSYTIYKALQRSGRTTPPRRDPLPFRPAEARPRPPGPPRGGHLHPPLHPEPVAGDFRMAPPGLRVPALHRPGGAGLHPRPARAPLRPGPSRGRRGLTLQNHSPAA